MSLQPRLLLDTVGYSAITLLEIAILVDDGQIKLKCSLEEFFDCIQSHPALRLFPLTHEIAADVTMLGSLRDPADRTIAATARVHRLTLLTSAGRIVDSKLVKVID